MPKVIEGPNKGQKGKLISLSEKEVVFEHYLTKGRVKVAPEDVQLTIEEMKKLKKFAGKGFLSKYEVKFTGQIIQL